MKLLKSREPADKKNDAVMVVAGEFFEPDADAIRVRSPCEPPLSAVLTLLSLRDQLMRTDSSQTVGD